MVLRQFQGRVIKPLVKITDKDIETYYLKKTGVSSDIIELQLRQILISINDTMTPDVIDAKRKLSEEVHQKLTGGMEFADAVKIYSDDPKARDNGGAMPGMRLKDLSDVIRAEVESLEPGQFSPPVKTTLGFHIFYLDAKQFAGNSEFQGQKKQLEFELYSVELQNQTRRWLSEERQRSKVELVN
jgi:peptidyl-prolyl cis-trans isomerase SurA